LRQRNWKIKKRIVQSIVAITETGFLLDESANHKVTICKPLSGRTKRNIQKNREKHDEKKGKPKKKREEQSSGGSGRLPTKGKCNRPPIKLSQHIQSGPEGQ